jgi:hypothetical protein
MALPIRCPVRPKQILLKFLSKEKKKFVAHYKARHCSTSSGPPTKPETVALHPARGQQRFMTGVATIRELASVLDWHEHIIILELCWERPGRSITRSALPVTARERGCKHWRLPSKQRERHRLYYELRRNFTLRCQNWTFDTLGNTDEGLAHVIEDVVCAYMRGFIHVDACLSAIPINEQQCAFPCVEQKSLHLDCKVLLVPRQI